MTEPPPNQRTNPFHDHEDHAPNQGRDRMLSVETKAHMETDQPWIEENYHPSADGVRLYSCTYPVDNPVAVVLLTHGLGEHSGRYGHVLDAFHEMNLAVIRFDYRGHGKSDGQRGHADNYNDLMDDISTIVEYIESRFPNTPLILCGHSLGGNLIANWVLRRHSESENLIAAVLSSPWFLLSDRPSKFKESLIRTVSKLWPKFAIPARFRTRNLTRNQEAAELYEQDPLIHHQITARMTIESYDAALWALAHASDFPLPVLGLHGSADPVTCPEGTRQFCAAAPHADQVIFDNLVHEPHNEPEWRQVVKIISEWVDQQVQQYATSKKD